MVSTAAAIAIIREPVAEMEAAWATQLAIVAPGILGPHYFREVGAILEAAAGGPPDVAALGAVMRRRGLTPAP